MSHLLFPTRRASSIVLKCAVGAVVATPLVAICQASFFLLNYRLNYAHLPRPDCPSRGALVVKQPTNQQQESSENNNEGYTIKEASLQPPIRLLVIGDSLAMGVGQTDLPTPILPVSIARSLSKALGGRVVDWTCHGKPGLSAAQLVKEIELFQEEEASRWDKENSHSLKDATEVAFSRDDGTVNDFKKEQWKRWRTLCSRNGDYNDVSSHYDAVVVIIGMGDLKNAVLPFLRVDDNENHGKQQSHGFKDDLGRITDMFTPKDVESSATNGVRPLIVFPALPGKPVPIFQWPPLSWFIIPLLELLDEDKRHIVKDFVGKVLFVEEPTSEEFIDFEKRRGRHYAMLDSQDATFQVKDTGTSGRKDEKKGRAKILEESADKHSFSIMRPYPGSTLVARDKIHPNNIGYDFWGRCIASSILKLWDRDTARRTCSFCDTV